MEKKVEGVYRLEALGPKGAIEVMDVDLDLLAEIEDLMVLRLPKEEEFRSDMEDVISAIQSIAGDKKWLVIDHDVELLRVVKVA
ncbi:MAG: hypothetical protein WC479_07555 [Candidatus Izemoplasmatales bacterium]|jgi:hypothetical protein